MNELSRNETARSLWADALRTLCCLMVVIIHVSGTDWYTLPTDSADWLVSNIADSLVRPSVVLFFMLSGCFMLKKDTEPKKLLMKALRLAVLWLGASVFYTFYTYRTQIFHSPKLLIYGVVHEYYHLWFLRTMAVLYLLVPVLRALIVYQDGRWVKWFLGVFLVFGILRQSLGLLPLEGETWYSFRLLFVPELCQYSGYFVLGWYLTEKTAPAAGKKRVLYLLVYLLTAALIAVGTHFYSLGAEMNDERLYSYMGLPAFVMAVSLFQLARAWRETALTRLMAKLAPLTLGIYVFHPLMLELAVYFGVSKDWSRFAFIPAAVAAAFVGAALLSWCLRRVPFIKKFL